MLGRRRMGVARILAILSLPDRLACLAPRSTQRTQRDACRLSGLGRSVGLRCCVRAGALRVLLVASVGVLARLLSFEVHLGGQRMSICGSRVLAGGLNMGGSETAADQPSCRDRSRNLGMG